MKYCFCFIILLFSAQAVFAQPNKNKGKIVVKTYNAKGELISKSTASGKKIQNTKVPKGKVKMVRDANGRMVKKTVISLGKVINRAFDPDTIDKDHVVIQVYKKYDRLYIYYKGKFLTAYNCVFGKNKMGQKYREGDKKTPEGWFSITDVRRHGKWKYFMGIDYPNLASRSNHARAKAKGLIASNARIGGSVGIHGVWAGGDMAIKNKFHWTDGCVALNNNSIALLARIVQPGTRVYIGWEK